MRSTLLVLSLASFLMLFGTVASAQEEVPATGWMVQARMPATTLSSLVSSTLGSPQFLIGWRGDRFGLGAGLGMNRFSFKTETSGGGFSSEDKSTATVFQVAPAVWFDFMHSSSGNTVGNVLVSVGYGRVNAKTESSSSSPFGSGSSESKASGNLLDFTIGLGGDHFLGSHFALGVETGIHGAFAFDVEDEGGGGGTVGFSAALFYAGVRSTIVF